MFFPCFPKAKRSDHENKIARGDTLKHLKTLMKNFAGGALTELALENEENDEADLSPVFAPSPHPDGPKTKVLELAVDPCSPSKGDKKYIRRRISLAESVLRKYTLSERGKGKKFEWDGVLSEDSNNPDSTSGSGSESDESGRRKNKSKHLRRLSPGDQKLEEWHKKRYRIKLFLSLVPKKSLVNLFSETKTKKSPEQFMWPLMKQLLFCRKIRLLTR